MSRARVVVVGGGLAGLSAAIRAADDGAAVQLFELAPRLGGATWSFTRDGLSYDNGQHVFMRCCTEYRAFLTRIGSAGKVTLQDRMDVAVLSPGGPLSRLRRVRLPAPLHLSSALARYRHLGPLDRVRVARTALALRRLDLGDPALDDQALADWLGDHGASHAAVEALWNLVCMPTVNLAAGEASLLLAATVFKAGLLDTADGGDIGWSAVPLQELHGSAAARVLDGIGAKVRTGARVDAVRSDPGRGPAVIVDGEEIVADAVVVAVPHDAVPRLLPPGSIDQQEQLKDLGRSPIVNIHLLYDRAIMDEAFIAGIDSPVQFVFDRTRSSGAPAGHQMVAISLSAADMYLPWSRHDLVQHFTGELQRLLPAAQAARVVTSMVTREVAATFRGGPGSARLRPGTRTLLPGVFLAGAWTATGWPATMEGAVRSGHTAAAEVSRHLTANHTLRGAAA